MPKTDSTTRHDMNMDMGVYGGVGGAGMVEKDLSPLPVIESRLFSDFSFGGESQSQPSSGIPSTTDFSSSSSSTPSILPPLSRSHTHALSLGLGLNLDVVIPPTSSSLARTNAELIYSPTQLPPLPALSTTSSSASVEASPLSAVGGSPETPATAVNPIAGASDQNPNTSVNEGGTVSAGAGRLPSLDVSAHIHLDKLYSELMFGAVQSYKHQQQQAHDVPYGGYYGHDVDPAEKRGEKYAGEGGYSEATA